MRGDAAFHQTCPVGRGATDRPSFQPEGPGSKAKPQPIQLDPTSWLLVVLVSPRVLGLVGTEKNSVQSSTSGVRMGRNRQRHVSHVHHGGFVGFCFWGMKRRGMAVSDQCNRTDDGQDIQCALGAGSSWGFHHTHCAGRDAFCRETACWDFVFSEAAS